ncbi:hypothetical protein SAMN05421747_11122 [Parapedobacter composti]|uniref:Uncharacterized protein n=1 Tax=Parapedobacter composti TaxID=623281 RepID=A0A1I1JAL3_9SPHI|nr:hypothetical protein [Parapedobacter composti]SFC43648.1 hypothetical protein SAMN05421747_11122 [Parapedobacter composti]
MKLLVLTIACGIATVFHTCSETTRKGDIRTASGSQEKQSIGAEHAISPANEEKRWPQRFRFGSRASAQDIRKLDIDVMPDGRGLLKGQL